MKWTLARVIELLFGGDGVARVAVLKTASGVTKRAVNKLGLLPLKDDVETQASLFRSLIYKKLICSTAVIIFVTKYAAAFSPRLLSGVCVFHSIPGFKIMQYDALCKLHPMALFLDRRVPSISVTLFPLRKNYIPEYVPQTVMY